MRPSPKREVEKLASYCCVCLCQDELRRDEDGSCWKTVGSWPVLWCDPKEWLPDGGGRRRQGVRSLVRQVSGGPREAGRREKTRDTEKRRRFGTILEKEGDSVL